jgi:hypothetical protein
MSTVLTLPTLPTAHNFDYETYRKICDDCVAHGSTTGPDQSDKLVQYTKLNVQRMKRVEQSVVLAPETLTALAALTSMASPMTWLVFTEAWCGDAAQILPVLNAMAQAAPPSANVTLRCLLRDENLPLMDMFLTNGARAIPKVVFIFDKSSAERGPNTSEFQQLDIATTWGPRPAEAQQQLDAWKAEGLTFDEFAPKLHKWYADDKTRHTQISFIHALKKALA